MDEVARTGIAVIITKNGKPVAELLPHRPCKQSARGILKGELFVTGDIIAPIHSVPDVWKNGRRCGHPCSISTTQALSNLIEVFFGPGRRAVPPPRWPDVLEVAEGPDVRKLPEAAPAAPQQAEELDGRKPPETAPVAELLVSQRRPEVG
jgi:antitoxin (DNA-binding transcriptional repressor) of toxin-antitoxin stability system